MPSQRATSPALLRIGCNREDGEMRLDSTVKVYLMNFADGLCVRWERKDDSKGFGLSNGKEGGGVLFDKEDCGKSRPGGN